MRKISLLSFLFLIALLLNPAHAFAQTNAAAGKSWNSFWTQFSQAVNKRSKPAVKRLMASEEDFSSGGGSEDRNEWLALADQYKWWGILQKSVRAGTKTYKYGGRPSRVTKNNHLIFAFIGGRWRFVGPMGD